MKKILYIVLLLTINVFAFSQTSVVQDPYWEQIKDQVQCDGSVIYSDTVEYGIKQAVKLMYGTIESPNYKSRLYFIDDIPLANWSHDCRYLFLNTSTMEFEIIEGKFPPKNYKEMSCLTEKPTPKNKFSKFDFSKLEPQRRLKNASGNDYGVIISGGTEGRFTNDCIAFYEALRYVYGYPADRIFHMAGDNIGSSSTYYAPSNLQSLTNMFDDLSAIVQPEDRVIIFVMEHGGIESGDNVFITLNDDEFLHDFVLANEIDKLNADFITTVIGSCNSGGFINDISGSNRAVLTACRTDENSWGSDLYDEFMYHFIGAIAGEYPDNSPIGSADSNYDGYISIREAFYFARGSDRVDETPQYNCRPASKGRTITLNGNHANSGDDFSSGETYDFSRLGETTDCNPFKTDHYFIFPWLASHGSPSCINDYLIYLEAEWRNTTEPGKKSEGVFIEYEFLPNHKYNVEFNGNYHYTGDLPYVPVNLVGKLVNEMEENDYTDCGKELLPNKTGKIIYDDLGPMNGQDALVSVNSDNFTLTNSERFSDLWVYNHCINLGTGGGHKLNSITITDEGIDVPASDEEKVYSSQTSVNLIHTCKAVDIGVAPLIVGTNMSADYQWQTKVAGGNWANVSGANSKNFTLFYPTSHTYVRRLANGNISNEFLIEVNPGGTMPNAITGDQTIDEGEVPETILGTEVSGPFEWMKKEGDGAWTTIPGATARDYSPVSLSVSTTYKRIANGVESNEVLKTVIPLPEDNSITGSQTINAGQIPTITGTDITGPFSWQSKVIGGNWKSIHNSNTKDLSPVGLIEETRFRRRVNSNYSNEVVITVLTGSGQVNSISTTQTEIPYFTSPTITGNNISGPFQWQSRVPDGNWVTENSNTKDISPWPLIQTKEFRRIANGAASNIVQINVRQDYPCTEGEQFLFDDFSQWHVSHGYPEFQYNKNLEIKLRSNWKFELFGSYRKSDGVYMNYNFIKGITYQISYYAMFDSDDNVYNVLKVSLAQNIDAHPGDMKKVNTNAERQVILGHDDTEMGVQTITITPTENFNQLWFYPRQPWASNTTPSVKISRVAIKVSNLDLSGIYFYHPWINYKPKKAEVITTTTPFLTVNSGVELDFIATKSITLNDGFHAQSGSEFSARIEPIYRECVNNKNVLVSEANVVPHEDELATDTVPDIQINTAFQNINESIAVQSDEVKMKRTCMDVRIFPNPNDGIFTVNIPDDFDCKRLAIANASGKIVYLNNFENQKNLEMDIRNMPPGVYFIKLISADKVLSRKIIKE